MKTVSITRFGGPEVLAVIDKPVLQPGPDEVAIDVMCAGVNFAEILYRRGIAPNVALPFTPGIEVAGLVRAVGTNVRHLDIGQRVAALTIVNSGGYAEVAVTHAALAVAIPDSMPWTIAAGAPSNTTTAVMILRDLVRLQHGETVLIHAAAGGVGSMLGQVARLLGAGQVIGTVGSLEKADYAKRFGFDRILAVTDDLGEQLKAIGGIDVVVDAVGGSVRIASLAALKPGGKLVSMGNASGAPDVPLSATDLWISSKAVLGFNLHLLSKTYPEQVGAALRFAMEQVAQSKLVVDVTDALPLEYAAQAQRQIESRQSRGKLVLKIKEM